MLVVTDQIAKAGAPVWAKRAYTEPSIDTETVLHADWRDAWDHAAADTALASIDARDRLAALARERDDTDRRCRQLFAELVRERTFYELDRRLSPSVKSALVEFVRALAKIGKGTGVTAGQHRRTAREAMARCYDAVPCWIMPTWRVAEQLPADLGALDLVIIDEASQSDVTELPALLRGRKILVVGDDRQVSPTAPFVTQAKIAQLRHHYLGELPFKNLLEPGESIYDLMRAVFPNDRLMLKEHFRCVEPIIHFSTQFYPEKMLPLRIPTAQERLDPPLVDIYLPHGRREKRRKINHAEADVIVREIVLLAAQPAMHKRSIGVISLVGGEQAEHIRAKRSEAIGEELMQRHAILCGDSATFQGTERDIVFLSMVADPIHRTALTMLRYEQRFNVAMSRGRDRVVLVRSVRRDELNPEDLKARLIAHFENPMPPVQTLAAEGLEACDSGFERDLMRKLLERGYRVQPQVGSLGYRIDMVVEGSDGRRLAVECDGDRFHGPEQWREDMRRQRVLERVGWRFWRCFASSFYRDTDRVINDLFEMLSRLGIEPLPEGGSASPNGRFTEHRIVTEAQSSSVPSDLPSAANPILQKEDGHRNGITVDDKFVIIFGDDKRRIALRLTHATQDLEKGMLSSQSALGKAIRGAEEGDEVEFQLDDGRPRKALIESVMKVSTAPQMVVEKGPLTTAA
jgi:very-short-patch-repair endonuclease